MQGYGRVFSRVYDGYWSGFSLTFAPVIQSFLGPVGQKSLLDVCCGTGRLSRHFLEQGWQVTGLDLSPDMLEVARDSNADFIRARSFDTIHADAREFSTGRRYAVVTSLFDALNHLDGEEALASCFRSVHASLQDGGRFVFDLNTRKGLRNWDDLTVREEEDLFLVTRGMFVEDLGKAYMEISGFHRPNGGQWQRFRETMFNSCFDLGRVKSLLQSAGFSSIELRSADRNFAPVEDGEGQCRVFFVAARRD
jgi:SAM-dependent methyltransferase